MPYVTEFRESEQGWGCECWYRGYDTEEEAKAAAKEINDKNTAKVAPRIYTAASYKGFMDKVPKDDD